jgi:hypothetical protein
MGRPLNPKRIFTLGISKSINGMLEAADYLEIKRRAAIFLTGVSHRQREICLLLEREVWYAKAKSGISTKQLSTVSGVSIRHIQNVLKQTEEGRYSLEVILRLLVALEGSSKILQIFKVIGTKKESPSGKMSTSGGSSIGK